MHLNPQWHNDLCESHRILLKLYLLHVEPDGDENGHTGQLLSHKACFSYHSPVAVLPNALIPSQFLQESLIYIVIREWLGFP